MSIFGNRHVALVIWNIAIKRLDGTMQGSLAIHVGCGNIDPTRLDQASDAFCLGIDNTLKLTWCDEWKDC
jgi:hypothetical protein